jgi:hypothetical protein
VSRPTSARGPARAQAPATAGTTTITEAFSAFGATTTQPPVTGPTTTAEPTTTAPTTTAAPTTTLASTTSTDPTTSGPTTTGVEPTTTGPAILGDSQPASVSAATVGALPVLGLLYLLRALLPQPGGAHSRRRRAEHLRCRG